MPLPSALYSTEQVRELDRLAIQNYGIAGIDLMNRAGRFTFRMLRKTYPKVKHIAILCGSGNNAGDGYIIAALAQLRGFTVDALYCTEPEKLQGDARQAYQFAIKNQVSIRAFDLEHWHQHFVPLPAEQIVFIDALLGTGLKGDVRARYKTAINCLNQHPAPVVAVDIPSGLSADTGKDLGIAVKASITASYIGLKQGLFTGKAGNYCGSICFDDLGVPPEVYTHFDPQVRRLELESLLPHLPQREQHAHKGHFGHVLVIGGDQGFGGAVIMAAEAAARSGAGLTTVATHPNHIPALLARCPEIMARGVSRAEDLKPLINSASVIVVGPGLGQSKWSHTLLDQALQSSVPLVVDADALNILSQRKECHKRENWLLSPHPGEAARLLNTDVQQIQSQRFDAVSMLQNKWGGHIILKGAGTLIAHPDGNISLCDQGNPGMASGGMGDVLSGILGGLIAQKLDLDLAARLAVCVHATAADIAVKERGQRGLLASDLIPYVRQLLNRL